MATIKLTGKVLHVGEEQQISATFTKRSIVVEEEEINDNGKYVNEIEIDFINKNIDRIQYVKVGDTVEISASVRSREGSNNYAGRWFTNINGFFCKVTDKAEYQEQAQQEVPQDDLPF